MGQLRSHLDSISIGQKDMFIRNLRNLLKVNRKIKNVEKPAELARLSMLEGQLTARLFTAFLPFEYTEAKNYRKYIKYFTRLAREINAFDSLVDLPADYSQGDIKVKPTLENTVFLAANIIGNTIYIATHTNPRLLRSFGSGVKTVAKDRNGMSAIHFTKP